MKEYDPEGLDKVLFKDLGILPEIFRHIPAQGNQINIIVLGPLKALKEEINVLKDAVRELSGNKHRKLSPAKQDPEAVVFPTGKKSRSEIAKEMWARRKAFQAQKENSLRERLEGGSDGQESGSGAGD